MDQERKGQIAFAVVKRELQKDGIRFDEPNQTEIMERIGDLNKVQPGLDVSSDEFVEFSIGLTGELVDEYSKELKEAIK